MATRETREELQARLDEATSPAQAAAIRTKLAAPDVPEPHPFIEPDEEPSLGGEGQEVTAEDLPEGVFDPDSPLTPAEQLADYNAAVSRGEITPASEDDQE